MRFGRLGGFLVWGIVILSPVFGQSAISQPGSDSVLLTGQPGSLSTSLPPIVSSFPPLLENSIGSGTPDAANFTGEITSSTPSIQEEAIASETASESVSIPDPKISEPKTEEIEDSSDEETSTAQNDEEGDSSGGSVKTKSPDVAPGSGGSSEGGSGGKVRTESSAPETDPKKLKEEKAVPMSEEIAKKLQASGIKTLVRALTFGQFKDIEPFLSPNGQGNLSEQVRNMMNSGEMRQFAGMENGGYVDSFINNRASIRFGPNSRYGLVVEYTSANRWRIHEIYPAARGPTLGAK